MANKKLTSPKKRHLSRFITHTPDKVYTVTNRKAKQKLAPTKAKKRKKNKYTHTGLLHRTVKPKIALVIIGLCLIVAFASVLFAGSLAQQARYEATKASLEDGLDAATKRKLYLLGDSSLYPQEITNLQSAPESLREYVLKDYRYMKSACIINGELITPFGYEITNVVYDAYARIEKTCGGSKPVIVKLFSDTWTVVHEGSAPIPCSTVNAFEIPRGVAATCITGTVTYTNPNP